MEPSSSPMPCEERRLVLRPWLTRGQESPFTVSAAEGIYLWDTAGTRYVDLSSQLVSTNLGHGDSGITASIADQAKAYAFVSADYGCVVRTRLAKALCSLLPPSFGAVYFSCGGAEAVDAAISVARDVRQAPGIVARYASYHGSSGVAGCAGHPPRAPRQYPAHGAGIVHVPEPLCTRCPFGLRRGSCSLACAEYVGAVIEREGPESIAAVLMETVTGTAGVIVPPKGYYERIRRICDETGVLWIADEVLTGFGRTGAMFAFEHWKAAPDIVVMSKGLTSSYLPLGATACSERVACTYDARPFPVGHTYSGHPLSCAAGIAALDAYRERDITGHAARLGSVFSSRLPALVHDGGPVCDARGLGCLWALECAQVGEQSAPAVARALRDACRDQGLLLLVRANLLIVAPPLVMTVSQAHDTLTLLQGVIECGVGGPD